MRIDEVRVYAECLEQGLDFKDYLLDIDKNLKIYNVYIPKPRGEILDTDSKLFKILKLKNFDLAISIISDDNEIPILLVEYSTAVPTDDHKMQRSDVYFWAGVFKIPVMKISPLYKNSLDRHGGSDKLNIKNEQALTLKNNCLVYFVDFKADTKNNLITNINRPSCIAKSREISIVLAKILKTYEETASESSISAYDKLLNLSKKEFGNYDTQALKDLFPNSARFARDNNGKDIVVKINRLSHAMDSDRGILFFMNMLFGIDNTIAKIIIKRERESGRESYDALFGMLPSNKRVDISKKIEQGFTQKTTLEIFQIATGIHLKFTQDKSNFYSIQDDFFKNFLRTCRNNVYKSIFINSKALLLCDYNHNLLCKVSWNTNVAKKYTEQIGTNISNYVPLTIEPLSFKDMSEDIITFASAKIFKQLGCEILALSYPGAQGDKAILVGSGRAAKRIYIDIVASKKSDKFYIFLHENKGKAKKMEDDAIKLKDIKDNRKENLNAFLLKVGKEVFDELFLGVGSRLDNKLAGHSFSGIDYIFAFSLDSQGQNTNIEFNIDRVNPNLVEFFKSLVNAEGKLQGKIEIDKVYRVKK